MMIFDNNWWTWFLSNYSYSVAIISGLIKVLAMSDEGTPTNKIVDYLIGIFKK